MITICREKGNSLKKQERNDSDGSIEMNRFKKVNMQSEAGQLSLEKMCKIGRKHQISEKRLRVSMVGISVL